MGSRLNPASGQQQIANTVLHDGAVRSQQNVPVQLFQQAARLVGGQVIQPVVYRVRGGLPGSGKQGSGKARGVLQLAKVRFQSLNYPLLMLRLYTAREGQA